MKRIVFATGNEGKLREIREILNIVDASIVSMKEAGVRSDIVEDGSTFEENAVIKAVEVQKLLKDSKEFNNSIVLADDSGLEVDALNGEPGIYSARYAGADTPYQIKNQLILDKLRGVPDEKRTARFVCVAAAAFPDGTIKTARATIEGRIGYEERGSNGFGYDPIFFLTEYGCTTAELTMEQKNELSHRGKALRELAKFL